MIKINQAIITLLYKLGIESDLNACDAVGGKTVSNINDPSNLIAAGLTDAIIGDK